MLELNSVKFFFLVAPFRCGRGLEYRAGAFCKICRTDCLSTYLSFVVLTSFSFLTAVKYKYLCVCFLKF